MIGKPVALIQVPNQRAFSVTAAAQYLGICRNTLVTITELGQIKAYDFNGRRAYKLEDLDALIESWPEWQNACGEKPVAQPKETINAIG